MAASSNLQAAQAAQVAQLAALGFTLFTPLGWASFTGMPGVLLPYGAPSAGTALQATHHALAHPTASASASVRTRHPL